MLLQIKQSLKQLADPETARVLQSFFKTAPGEYGEGDIFLGIKVPPLRKVAVEFKHSPLSDLKQLLQSKIHEERSLALMILTNQFAKADENRREEIFEFYLRHLRFINNWDLVDGSAPYIAGPILFKRDRSLLYKLARSKSLWERRISILTTFHFIRQNDFDDALKISELLLKDDEDLIHKAVGWMLREIGKRDLTAEERFLKKHYRRMPRTMLRYAIERFPEPIRKAYLAGSA